MISYSKYTTKEESDLLWCHRNYYLTGDSKLSLNDTDFQTAVHTLL